MKEMPGYQEFSFTHEQKTRIIYWRGQGPPVLLMHELPGMTRACVDLADRLARDGFRVYLPLMFGKPGDNKPGVFLLQLCISREFRLLAAHKTSPITSWLRALSKHISHQNDNARIGAIGMCLSGGFALALVLENHVAAPILSQPSLPLVTLPLMGGKRRKQALGLSPEDMKAVKARVLRDKVPLLGLCFSKDKFCPPERFEALKNHFPDAFDSMVIPSGNGTNIHKKAHSVLTDEFVADDPSHPTQEAYRRVVTLFRDRLLPS